MFAPRLGEGDSVAYITVKDSYPPVAFGHWRLVTMLRVAHRLNRILMRRRGIAKGILSPSNCMVAENACFPYDMTAGTEARRATRTPPAINEVQYDALHALALRN